MKNITYILYDFYQEFTEIQGKKDSEIGKMHREFLTALVGKNLSNAKAKLYLEKSQALTESKIRAGKLGAQARYGHDSSANGSATSSANGSASVLPMAIEEKRVEENRIDSPYPHGRSVAQPKKRTWEQIEADAERKTAELKAMGITI